MLSFNGVFIGVLWEKLVVLKFNFNKWFLLAYKCKYFKGKFLGVLK